MISPRMKVSGGADDPNEPVPESIREANARLNASGGASSYSGDTSASQGTVPILLSGFGGPISSILLAGVDDPQQAIDAPGFLVDWGDILDAYYNLSEEQLKKLQLRLWEAGLLPGEKDAVVTGKRSAADRAALNDLYQDTASQAVSLDASDSDRKVSMDMTYLQARDAHEGGGGAGAGKESAADERVEVPSEADSEKAVIDAVVNAIGRLPTDDELASLVDTFQNAHRRSQVARRALNVSAEAGENAGGEVSAPPSPDALFEQALAEKFAGTIRANRSVEEMNVGQHNLFNMVQQLGGMVGSG